MARSNSLTSRDSRTSRELAPLRSENPLRQGNSCQTSLFSSVNRFECIKRSSEQSVQIWYRAKNLEFHNHRLSYRSIYTILATFLCLIGRITALHQGGGETTTSTVSMLKLETFTKNLYQPSLIGFRCDISHEVTKDGVSVIEANKPVTLTLYGESFTTDTIVAFTTEFRPDTNLDPNLSTYFLDETSLAEPAPTSTGAPNVEPTTMIDSVSPGAIQAVKQSAETAPRGFRNRRRTQSLSYDCTDYNRVTSYKLSKEDILTPNVVVLTVVLPELDLSSGMYYYFCLKQPRLTASFDVNNSPVNESLIWVHQGTEWWVTLRVEPPILSIANDCILIMLLLFLSAVTSGLNLGLMSLDMNELAVISASGDPRERSYARTIAPLRKRGNYLLCSLLLGNVMVNSTLTVILEEMTSGVVAVIGSTLAIVVLGEIVPQAFCARQGLAIGAKTIYLTYAFMIITFPLSYPIACLLDYVLGEEKGNVYDRERLMEFIKITGHHTQLEADEVAIISGALKLKKIKVDQIMTRIEDVFMLPIDCRLDRDTIKRIIEKGYSRIPVYEFGDRKQIVALILAKDLALLDPDDHTPIASMLMYCKHPLIFIEDDATLDVALNEFKTGKSHMAVVRQIYDDGEVDKYYEAIGVVTLEDVIEEVLQVEINDETDTLSDNRRKRRRTDAQVSHLIDDFTCRSLPSSGVCGHTLLGKPTESCLSDQLTCVSVESVAQSLAQTTQKSQPQSSNGAQPPASPKQQSQASFRSAREFSASDCLQMTLSQDSPNLQSVTAANDVISEDGSSVLSRAAQYLSNIIR